VVSLPPGLRLSFEDQPSWADREFIDNALGEYNAPFLRDPGYSYFGIFVRADNGAIRAGLIGNCYAGWLFVNLLWIHAELRRQGLGRRLIGEAERHALAFGCHSAYVDTFSYQAPDFYRKLGFEVYGTLDYPPAHKRYFLSKPLLATETSPSAKPFPVSVKGVLLEGDRVVLLENERLEWELPGGRLERGEEPGACLAREFAEELGADIAVASILDCWVYEVLPHEEVVIATYGVRRLDRRAMQVSREHRRFGRFAISELDGLPMPEGYRRGLWIE
jgi:8-oxo-dGTP pyrophosphatase MutT (NUDIX family)/GNAT superfamily N-acetyltransferase